MAIRAYLVPKAGSGTATDPFRPAYVADLGVSYRAMDYGREPTFLVLADVTPAQHTAITANADVVSAPADLTATIGASLATVQTQLEARNIPADWITSGMTYRAVLRWISALFRFVQRFNGLYQVVFFATGVTLDTTVGSLTATQRQRLQATADNLGLDTSTITLATTIRQALRTIGQQLPEWSAV